MAASVFAAALIDSAKAQIGHAKCIRTGHGGTVMVFWQSAAYLRPINTMICATSAILYRIYVVQELQKLELKIPNSVLSMSTSRHTYAPN